VHHLSFTFRFDEPERLLETIWTAHPGWGYIKRKDLWVREDGPPERFLEKGYIERKPPNRGDVTICPSCSMYISSVPPSLTHKHLVECKGSGLDWAPAETKMIDNKRLADYERRLRDKARSEKEEREAAEKRERFDRIKEEAASKQVAKDRKKRLKEETKKEWKKR
jgi:hypothetical protein